MTSETARQAVPVMIAQLYEDYCVASYRQIEAQIKLTRLCEAAERGDIRHEEADDFRHHTYLDQVDQAYDAAFRLLNALGYEISPADEDDDEEE